MAFDINLNRLHECCMSVRVEIFACVSILFFSRGFATIFYAL